MTIGPRLLLVASVLALGCAAPRSAQDSPSGILGSPETDPGLTGAPPSLGRTSAATPRPTAEIGRPASVVNPRLSPPPEGITGQATWYATFYGTAAAGPGLRYYLGPSWRGTRVRVTAPGCGCPPVVVVLSDWCLCTGGDRIIDVNSAQFANLAPLSVGVLRVTVVVAP